MNAVSKMTLSSILAILVVAVSSGSYRMIQVSAQQTTKIIEAFISKIPEIRACQMLHPSWNASATSEDFKQFEQKDCWKQLARNPITGEFMDPSTTPP